MEFLEQKEKKFQNKNLHHINFKKPLQKKLNSNIKYGNTCITLCETERNTTQLNLISLNAPDDKLYKKSIDKFFKRKTSDLSLNIESTLSLRKPRDYFAIESKAFSYKNKIYDFLKKDHKIKKLKIN